MLSHAQITDRLRAAGCVFAEEEADLLLSTSQDLAELEELVRRRAEGFPLEYLLGWAEFCGLRIAVTPGVFVPRRRTEFLAAQAIELAQRAETAVLLDLCCGAGAVAAAVAAALPGVELYAADIDPEAVGCARRNLSDPGNGTVTRVFEGDLFAPLPDSLAGRINVIAVNAPYVPTEEIALMPPEARLYEARAALDGGTDGLQVQRRIAAEASRWLAPEGHLLIETSERQAPQTAEIFAARGLKPQILESEEFYATVVIGKKAGQRQ
ncbi:release factor glutamine methyltransferase [Psychromicrobium silvestre]|uniref:peptide chain release factor N(5)-glutamine methyltransferase n=1 Tax=Psychromicrobium silvestre TaxID=1645614 RepID=A0A7Y9LQV8_9MICC|nr:putative protein N(5)-glutamine methyltransferase [Psychromicrobium silvestre]NYE93927.1 release factor glutamine methyltransferase [Psychromicrobium silvestre]